MSVEHTELGEPLRQATAVDRICAVFAYLPEDKLVFHPVILTRTFQELSKEFPDQFGSMGFGKPGSVIKSEQLYEARRRLDMSGLSESFISGTRVTTMFDRDLMKEYLSQFDDLNVGESISSRFTELHNYFEENSSEINIIAGR